MDKRYCQQCSTPVQIGTGEEPKPCRHCGGVMFNSTPPPHSAQGYTLSDKDKDFLRTFRIDPEK